jgi:hypothetical protein
VATALGQNVNGSGAISLSTSPTFVTPVLGNASASTISLGAAGILDANGKAMLAIVAGTTPVNSLALYNAATGSSPQIAATGSDANIGINLVSQGTGRINFVTAAPTNPLLIVSGTTSEHNTLFDFSDTSATRTVTFPDASGTVLFSSGSGGLKSYQIFTTGTGATYTTPAGITSILVELWGGGGGGGGVTATASSASAAGGGGAGGYARLYVASAAGSYTYTVGGGGAGGTAGTNTGTTGGTTSFSASSLQATGGVGGIGSAGAITTASSFTLGGLGGVGTNGDVNANGATGGVGISVLGNAASGLGASSPIGGGGQSVISAAAGNNATVYASGGSGAMTGATTNRAGGNGSGGLIIVWQFA